VGQDTVDQQLNKIILNAKLIVRDSSNKKTSL